LQTMHCRMTSANVQIAACLAGMARQSEMALLLVA